MVSLDCLLFSLVMTCFLTPFIISGYNLAFGWTIFVGIPRDLGWGYAFQRQLVFLSTPPRTLQTWRHITKFLGLCLLGQHRQCTTKCQTRSFRRDFFFPSQLQHRLKKPWMTHLASEQLFYRHLDYVKITWGSLFQLAWTWAQHLNPVLTQPSNPELWVTEISKSPNGTYSFRVSGSPRFPASASFSRYFTILLVKVSDAFQRSSW